MDGHEFLIADKVAADQFRILGQKCRLFRNLDFWVDENHVNWAWVRVNGHVFAVPSLGPNWVFDPFMANKLAQEMVQKHEFLANFDDAQHAAELQSRVDKLRLGRLTERTLWALVQACRKYRSSVLRLPYGWFFRKLWGPDQCDWPRDHRKPVLLEILESLTWLHVGECREEGWPALGMHTALLSDFVDLPASESTNDGICSSDCPDFGGPRHDHVQVNLGRGLLGEMEQFAHADDLRGVRTYFWPTGRANGKVTKRKGKGNAVGGERPTLRKIGKCGRLITIYLPAVLGKMSECKSFSNSQQQLMQTIVRETTRHRKSKYKGKQEQQNAASSMVGPWPEDEPPNDLRPGAAEVIWRSQIKDTRGRSFLHVPILAVDRSYVGFNGNGKLAGQGYKLRSEKGWLARAGYDVDSDLGRFFADLAVLSNRLGLIAVGIHHPTQEVISLDKMCEMSSTPKGLNVLNCVHLRIFTEADYVHRWNASFGWETSVPHQQQPQEDHILQRVKAEIVHKGVSRCKLAQAIGKDASFLGKVLNAKKRAPAGLLEKAMAWLADRSDPDVPHAAEIAVNFRERGWSVVPQLRGAKKPPLCWKLFQDVLPTKAMVAEWWGKKWPDAGIALVLGPVSNLIVIDVDGPEAHKVLIERLGGEPIAPKVISGSATPYKYHLYFRCPDLPTRAKQTPWHPKLEFRGKGGIIIAPPSIHKSGRRYIWDKGRSPDDLEFPDLPAQVLDALKPALTPSLPPGPYQILPGGLNAAPMTRRFLAGEYANGKRWNDRLFLAACDLAGRGHGLDDAIPLLLAGAQPWNAGEEEAALRTINSAFSQPRKPGNA